MNLTNAQTAFKAIITKSAQAAVYQTRDDDPVENCTVVFIPGGPDGEATVDFIVSQLTQTPDFSDKITVGGATWRISDLEESFGGVVKTKVKKSTYWHSLDLQRYNTSTGAWANQATGLICLVEHVGSTEILAGEDARVEDVYTVRGQYITDVDPRDRLKWGSDYLMIQGVRKDPKKSAWIEFTATRLTQ